jgi:hypothetical protein
VAKDFYQAAIPEPVVLLGQRLHPFSIGHTIILERFENPFVMGGRADVVDLFTGIMVCCNEYDEFIKFIREDDIIAVVKKWAKNVGEFDFKEISQAFKDYIEEAYSNFPKYWYEDTKGKNTVAGASFAQNIKVRLLRNTTLTEKEILNRPLALSMWDSITILEQDGALRINTKEDDEIKAQEELFNEWVENLPEDRKVKFGVN